MRTPLADKVMGCLIGGAIGDTLGRPVEGWDYPQIVARYGVLEDPFPEGAVGDVGTDDTSLARLLCEAYLQKGRRLSAEDYAQAWLDRMDGRAYWFCMRNTLELLRSGFSPRSTGAMNIVTGSGLMAVNPIAIFNACDPEQAFLDTLELVGLFQRDLSVLTGAVLAAGMAEAFRPGATPQSIVEAAIRVAPDEPLVTSNRRSPDNLKDALIRAAEVGRRYADPLKLRPEAYEKLLQVQGFDPEETLVLAFALVLAAGGDTRQGIIGGANMGRDADTLGSLLGQFYGALNGLGSVPSPWVERFMQLSGAEGFVEMGQRMADLVAAKAQREAAIARPVLAAAPRAEQAPADDLISQKVSGCLLGAAVGSLVGRFVEYAAQQGRSRSPETLEAFAVEAPRLPWGLYGTDLAALMMIGCRAYMDRQGRPCVEDLARLWIREVEPLAFGDGAVVNSPQVDPRRYFLRNTYELLKMGCPARMVGAFNVPATTAFCVVGPAAAFNAGDPDQAYLDALSLASLFQRDRGIIVPGILAAAAAAALRPGATLQDVIDAAGRLAPSRVQVTAVPTPIDNPHDLVAAAVRAGQECTSGPELFARIQRDFVGRHLGDDPLELLAASLAVFVFAAGDAARAIRLAATAATMPRRTDMLAAACGLLGGALAGPEAVPSSWRAVFDGLSGAAALYAAAGHLARLALDRARRQTAIADQVGRLCAEAKG